MRAPDVALAAKLVPQRPAQSIGDKPAFDPKNDVTEEGDPAGRPDVGPHPSGGWRVGFKEAGESGLSLARMDVHGPGGNSSDHHLVREVVALDLTWFAPFAGQKGDERAQHVAGAPESLARHLDDRVRPAGFAKA